MRHNAKKMLFLHSFLLACAPLAAEGEGQIALEDKSTQYVSPATTQQECGYWFDVKGAFTYWEAMQENMELGVIGDTTAAADVINGSYVNMKFDYKPGFQVGMGFGNKESKWDIFANYTWFRSQTKVQTSLDTANFLESLYPAWEFPSTASGSFFSGKETWKVNMDLLDIDFGKWYCLGDHVMVHPFIGLRAPWIRQKVTVVYEQEIDNPTRNISVNESTRSWGIGPRMGLELDWLFGKGFMMYGTGGFDITYTEYTSLNYQQKTTDERAVVVDASQYTFHQNNLSYLRTHADVALGLGWGCDFSEGKRHVDLTLEYSFQAFFNQNMFRTFFDDQMYGKGIAPNGDLFLQGFTAALAFQF